MFNNRDRESIFSYFMILSDVVQKKWIETKVSIHFKIKIVLS
jgi:hypothetical protein